MLVVGAEIDKGVYFGDAAMDLQCVSVSGSESGKGAGVINERLTLEDQFSMTQIAHTM
jgi:hypothetical protein